MADSVPDEMPSFSKIKLVCVDLIDLSMDNRDPGLKSKSNWTNQTELTKTLIMCGYNLFPFDGVV